ncbi:MAG: glycosyltransferase family 4 protein [Bacteroides cellulosilyticus]
MNAKISFIPIWAENRAIYPLDKRDTNLYEKLKLEGKFVFQFAGNLGHAQGIDNLLAAIEKIDVEDIHFLFIGGGAKFDEISSFISHRGQKNVSLLGFQDRSQQNDFLNACDIGIVTLNDGMYGLGVPSKSYNIWAAGKPILYIGDDNSEIALCIKEFTLGWIVSPNDPHALKNMIEFIYDNRNNLSSIRNNARTVSDTIFAKDQILERYYTLLK